VADVPSVADRPEAGSVASAQPDACASLACTEADTKEPVQPLSGTLHDYLQKRTDTERVHNVGKPQSMRLDTIEFDDQ